MLTQTGHDVPRTAGIQKSCATCSLMQLCFPVQLEREDVTRLDGIVEHPRPLHRGGHLFRAGDRFRSLYVVRSGAFKSYGLSETGDEQIEGFHLPGEVLGFDAIGEGTHPSGAIALETASVCEIPFDRLEALAQQIPALQRHLLRAMSSEIMADHEMHQALAKRTAEERLAIFLLGLSDRLARRGLSPNRFRLSMPRTDLGSYLGLAPETMSRLFARFREKHWISGEGKDLIIEDAPALHHLAGRMNAAGAGRQRRVG